MVIFPVIVSFISLNRIVFHPVHSSVISSFFSFYSFSYLFCLHLFPYCCSFLVVCFVVNEWQRDHVFSFRSKNNYLFKFFLFFTQNIRQRFAYGFIFFFVFFYLKSCTFVSMYISLNEFLYEVHTIETELV